MPKPLFTKEELTSHEKALEKLEQDYRKSTRSHGDYWAERENLVKAHELEMVKRAQVRAPEYLNALIILAGSRGHTYVPFEHVFVGSDNPKIEAKYKECNTPETRRTLYTILQALTEIPHSWATSAFVRFLRGNGKQRTAKYHGAGLLGVDYGWKEDEVSAICKIITQEHEAYSKVVMSYTDLTEVERELEKKDPDYEVHKESKTDLRFAACARRDKEFLQKLCGMLEKEGLGPIPTPETKEPKGPRVPKVFKPGDVIRKATLRDLPLPAHVRIPVERLPSGMEWHKAKDGDWTKSTIDQVVVRLGDSGRYTYASIGREPDVAYQERTFDYQGKDWLDGATFVGLWKGKIVHSALGIKFKFRKPEKKKAGA